MCMRKCALEILGPRFENGIVTNQIAHIGYLLCCAYTEICSHVSSCKIMHINVPFYVFVIMEVVIMKCAFLIRIVYSGVLGFVTLSLCCLVPWIHGIGTLFCTCSPALWPQTPLQPVLINQILGENMSWCTILYPPGCAYCQQQQVYIDLTFGCFYYIRNHIVCGDILVISNY